MLPVSVPAGAEVALYMLLAQFFEQAEVVQPRRQVAAKVRMQPIVDSNCASSTWHVVGLRSPGHQARGMWATNRGLSLQAHCCVGHGLGFGGGCDAARAALHGTCSAPLTTHVRPSPATGQMQLMHSAQLFCWVPLPPAPPLAFHSTHHSIETDAATLLSLYAERKHVDCVNC